MTTYPAEAEPWAMQIDADYIQIAFDEGDSGVHRLTYAQARQLRAALDAVLPKPEMVPRKPDAPTKGVAAPDQYTADWAKAFGQKTSQLADEIAALQAERDGLRQRIDRLRGALGDAQDLGTQHEAVRAVMKREQELWQEEQRLAKETPSAAPVTTQPSS